MSCSRSGASAHTPTATGSTTPSASCRRRSDPAERPARGSSPDDSSGTRWTTSRSRRPRIPPHPASSPLSGTLRTTRCSSWFARPERADTPPSWTCFGTLDLTITDEAAAGAFDVSDYAAAFLFDADQEGVAATLTAFRNHYRAHFGDLASVEHGKWVATNTVPVGFFVFHRSAQDQTGTLEDHLAPMVVSAWPARYAGARGFVDRYREANDKVSGRDAERLKAIITATGQFDHPGDPMSVIIGRTGLPRAQFTTSPLSKELADFLTGTPWNDG